MSNTMTRKQWELFNQTIATATTVLEMRIAELKYRGADASMYESWMREALAAREELHKLGAAIPWAVWIQKEEAA